MTTARIMFSAILTPRLTKSGYMLEKPLFPKLRTPSQILPDDAQKYKKGAIAGDIVEIPLETKEFGRIAAQKVKYVLRQGIKGSSRIRFTRSLKSKNQGNSNRQSAGR